MTSFPSSFGLTVPSVIRRQQLQFDQCGITLAPNRQVSSTEQRHHQLLSLLLVPQSKPQTNSRAIGKGPFTGFLWELVQVWPYAAQGKPTSRSTQSRTRDSQDSPYTFFVSSFLMLNAFTPGLTYSLLLESLAACADLDGVPIPQHTLFPLSPRLIGMFS